MRGQVTAYRAGHVLGAAMFLIQIAGMRLLYTGDYSRLPDRHLSAADLPPETIDICAPSITPHNPPPHPPTLFHPPCSRRMLLDTDT